jgi:deoxycytidylate deaminase
MTNFIEHAINEAIKSPMSKQHGAVLVKNGKIISSAHNKYKQKSMTNLKDNSPEVLDKKLKRYRRHMRRSHSESMSFYEFCRMDGRLAASIHAEELAIMRAGTQAYGSTLYVVRYVRHNHSFTETPAESCPCKRCTKMCEKFKVKVFYTNALPPQ